MLICSNASISPVEQSDLARQIVNECADAFRTFSCDLIYQGYIPAECDFIGYAAAPVVRQSLLPDRQPSAEALKKAQLRQSAALKARDIMTKTFGLTLSQ